MSEVQSSQNDTAQVDAKSQTRRRFLTAATSVVGVAGVVGVATPFMGSWNPSEKAKAAGAPVKADIGKLEPWTDGGRRVARKTRVRVAPH
jgi:ubiquinol-cytochrome c reductase iron-sulfur subunit